MIKGKAKDCTLRIDALLEELRAEELHLQSKWNDRNWDWQESARGKDEQLEIDAFGARLDELNTALDHLSLFFAGQMM